MNKIILKDITFENVKVGEYITTFVLDPNPANFTITLPKDLAAKYIADIEAAAAEHEDIMLAVHDERSDKEEEAKGVYSFYIDDLNEKYADKIKKVENKKASKIVCNLVITDYMGDSLSMIVLNIKGFKA